MGNIKLKNGYCVVCNDGKLKPCIGKRDKAMCATHYWNNHQVSEAEKSTNPQYFKLKKQYIAEHPFCELAIEGICTGRAVDIHHSQGRGKNKLNIATFKAACRACHIHIGIHEAEAKANGHSILRLTKTNES